jgi:hypothetical protein
LQARSVEKFEATSIVVDGILYTVQAPNDVVVLDAVHSHCVFEPSALTRSPIQISVSLPICYSH